MIEFLNSQRDHLDLCIRDAVALAEDVQMRVDAFNEKKCRDYLRLIEPSIENIDTQSGRGREKGQ